MLQVHTHTHTLFVSTHDSNNYACKGERNSALLKNALFEWNGYLQFLKIIIHSGDACCCCCCYTGSQICNKQITYTHTKAHTHTHMQIIIIIQLVKLRFRFRKLFYISKIFLCVCHFIYNELHLNTGERERMTIIALNVI